MGLSDVLLLVDMKIGAFEVALEVAVEVETGGLKKVDAH